MAQNQTVPVERLLAPFREFVRTNAASGIVLITASIAALVLANSPLAGSYDAFWATPITVGLGSAAISDTLGHWVNDGLMAIFFLVVGLEIKRELVVGELSSVRGAALPVAAAIGGALLPALIFAALVRDDPAARGWGVPMATDIAFTLGVLALLGRRIPAGLRLFVAAMAIVDDLLAVLVIALFYTPSISGEALAVATGIFLALIAVNRLGVRTPTVYAILGIALWLAVLESGIHATVAGVLLAATIPSGRRVDPKAFVAAARDQLDRFDREGTAPGHDSIEAGHAALWDLEAVVEHAQAPMLKMEHALQPWVAWVIVPVFALANAGVRLGGDLGALVQNPIAIGVVAGLVLGKQLGITAGAFLAVRAGIAALPAGVRWPHVYGAAWLGGIGFTMSLFVASLAYDEAGPELTAAKVGILVASATAALGGAVVLRLAPRMLR